MGDDLIEELLKLLKRSHIYCVNLGEIHFQQNALKLLYKGLNDTLVGFIFIEANYNRKDEIDGYFRHTGDGNHLRQNRKKMPAWHKDGKVAPWYDIENRDILLEDGAMPKAFFGSHNSAQFRYQQLLIVTDWTEITKIDQRQIKELSRKINKEQWTARMQKLKGLIKSNEKKKEVQKWLRLAKIKK